MKSKQFQTTLKSLDEIQEHMIQKNMRSSVAKLRRVRADMIKLKLELDADKEHIDHDHDIHQLSMMIDSFCAAKSHR